MGQVLAGRFHHLPPQRSGELAGLRVVWPQFVQLFDELRQFPQPLAGDRCGKLLPQLLLALDQACYFVAQGLARRLKQRAGNRFEFSASLLPATCIAKLPGLVEQLLRNLALRGMLRFDFGQRRGGKLGDLVQTRIVGPGEHLAKTRTGVVVLVLGRKLLRRCYRLS
jgi:hypothetical protein